MNMQQIPGNMPPVPPGAPVENWLPQPQAMSGVPAGLEYLSQVDQLLVKQKIELTAAGL